MKKSNSLVVVLVSLLTIAIATAAATTATVSSSSQSAAELENIITGRNFAFEIDGKQIPIISVEPGSFRCELKDATMGNRASRGNSPSSDLDRCEERDASGGDRRGNQKEFTVTKPHFDTWRVEKYYDQGDLTLKELFEAFASGERKTNPSDTGSLIYLDRDGNEARRIDFYGFTPVRYESISVDSRNAGQAATEVMEFSVQRVEYSSAAPGDGGKDGKEEEKKETEKEKKEEPTKTRKGTLISSFTLDISGAGEGPAANWYSISGGHQVLHSTNKTTGSDQFSLQTGGDVEFTEVEVVGPFVSGGTRTELLQLLNQWATQEGERFNATLELLDSNQQVVRTINFYDCIPTYYAPPSVRAGDDSLLEERFSFKPERVEG